MKKFTVMFFKADGTKHVRNIEALTAMFAIKMAHDQICLETTLADSVAVTCTSDEWVASKETSKTIA